MNLQDILTWITQIIIIAIILFVVYQLYRWLIQPILYKGRGYSNINADYIHPVLYPDFITPSENNHILSVATPRFAESQLVSRNMDSVRKSETAWLSRDDPIISKIIRRVCDLTNLPFDNAEKMQVVKYDPNGYYNPHYDASCDDCPESVEFEKNGGQRVITMLLYLNDNYEGGETDFPNLHAKYKPAKNTGLLFYSLEKEGNLCHPLSLHAGTPVLSGNKYIANVWLRETAYDVNK